MEKKPRCEPPAWEVRQVLGAEETKQEKPDQWCNFPHRPVGGISLLQWSVRCWFFSLIQDMGSYRAKAGLELAECNLELLILLAPPRVFWDCRQMLPCLVYVALGLHACQASTAQWSYVPSPLAISWYFSQVCSPAPPVWLMAPLTLFLLLALCSAGVSVHPFPLHTRNCIRNKDFLQALLCLHPKWDQLFIDTNELSF